MGDGGEIYILDMGEPVRIADLGEEGMRPGEKLFEELAVDDESADKTRHPKIFVGKMRVYEQERIEKGLAWLAAGVGLEPVEIRARFADLVPEYHCPEDGVRAVKAGSAGTAVEKATPGG
jgi:FlaA1/EpsC-like NDP-sugar epimerase